MDNSTYCKHCIKMEPIYLYIVDISSQKNPPLGGFFVQLKR